MAYLAVRGIVEGKIWWSRKHALGFWIYEDQQPSKFWILITFYSAISIWMIRGTVLELKIVKRMLRDRRKEK